VEPWTPDNTEQRAEAVAITLGRTLASGGRDDVLLHDRPFLLTIEEAAALLRIGRSHAYVLAHRYEKSDGTDGLPVMRLGSCMRVPRSALAELISTGRVVRLAEWSAG
jgi:excisionase family DNA binding protein